MIYTYKVRREIQHRKILLNGYLFHGLCGRVTTLSFYAVIHLSSF